MAVDDSNRTTSRDVVRMLVADGARMASGIDAMAERTTDHEVRLTRLETKDASREQQTMGSRFGPLIVAAAPGFLVGAVAWGTATASIQTNAATIERVGDEITQHAAELNHPHGVAASVERLRADVTALERLLTDHGRLVGHPGTVEQVAAIRAGLEEVKRTRRTQREGDAVDRAVEKLSERVTVLERRAGGK